MPMNPEVKALWLEALRSGGYTQGKEALNRSGNFCCLGVLCDVALKNGVALEVVTRNVHTCDPCRDNVEQTTYNGVSGTLPYVVRDWAGLSGDNPNTTEDLPPDDESADIRKASLAELNDIAEYNFNQIADVIERDF